MNFVLGELFCGPGGLALGAALAGHNSNICDEYGEKYTIRHLWGVDRDKYAIDTYNANISNKYGGEGIKADAIEFVENMTAEQKRINALAFGFPCNDFSLVGKQKGMQGKYGMLYRTGIRVIEQCKPLWFVAENVSGIKSSNSGNTFKQILAELENAGKGYNITTNLYKFEQYGVPQFRHRYIIVGIRKDQNLFFKVPKPTTPEKTNYKCVEEALKNISDTLPNMQYPVMDKKVIDRLKLTPPWQNAWFMDVLLQKSPSERRDILKELEWYNEEFSEKTDEDIVKMIQSCMLHCTKARMSHIYKRLKKDLPSYTVTGSGGGGTRIYHWCEHRSLTNRERARIQTFPDDFVFMGGTEDVRKQIGMAVPTLGAKIIFEHILKTFAHIPYESVEANLPLNTNEKFVADL